MKIETVAVAFAVVFAGLGLTNQAMAESQQQVMSDCAKQWDALKAANKTGGKTYQDFNKDCLSKDKTAEKPAAATTPAMAAPAAAAAKPAAAAVIKKVNLNVATAADLNDLPQIGEARSKAIIEARAKAPFKNWDDFVTRKVVPSNAEAAIKDLVSF
jgi:competence protein ComEA